MKASFIAVAGEVSKLAGHDSKDESVCPVGWGLSCRADLQINLKRSSTKSETAPGFALEGFPALTSDRFPRLAVLQSITDHEIANASFLLFGAPT